MLTLITRLAADNPGVFVDRSAAAPDTVWWLMACAALAIGGGSVFVCLLTSSDPDLRWRGAVAFIAGTALIGGSIVGMVSLQGDSDRAEAASVKAVAAYNGAVANWVGVDYGIAVTPDVARELVAGESYVAEFAGKPTTISIVKTVDGHLAIIDENRSPLVPRR